MKGRITYKQTKSGVVFAFFCDKGSYWEVENITFGIV